jgi:hypothetical protein
MRCIYISVDCTACTDMKCISAHIEFVPSLLEPAVRRPAKRFAENASIHFTSSHHTRTSFLLFCVRNGLKYEHCISESDLSATRDKAQGHHE